MEKAENAKFQDNRALVMSLVESENYATLWEMDELQRERSVVRGGRITVYRPQNLKPKRMSKITLDIIGPVGDTGKG